MRPNKDTKIPIRFQEEESSTKLKLANLLKRYNACMKYNPDENIYEVDVQVKFNSHSQKMSFMHNYLTNQKRNQQHILEQQQHNQELDYASEQKKQKNNFDLSTIKKKQEAEHSMSHNQFLNISDSKKGFSYSNSPMNQNKKELADQIDFQQLSLRIEESIDRSCEKILLMKLKPQIAQQNHQEEHNIFKYTPTFDSNYLKSREEYSIFQYLGKSKTEIMEQVSKEVIINNRQDVRFDFQQNLLFVEGDSETSNSQNLKNDKISGDKKQMSIKSNISSKKQSQKSSSKIESQRKSSGNNQSNLNLSQKSSHSKKISVNSQSDKKQYKNRQMKESFKLDQQQYYQKQSIQKCKLQRSVIQSNRSAYGMKSNQLQHQQFKKFLNSHKQKLDNIVQNYKEAPNSIYIQDESGLDISINEKQQFSHEIIQEYRKKIVANLKTMNNREIIGYFKFLIKHAKQLYLDFLRGNQK